MTLHLSHLKNHLLLLLSLLLIASHSHAWEQTIHDTKITWNQKDITIHQGKKLLFSAHNFAQHYFETHYSEHLITTDQESCEYEHQFQLLSIVGDLVSRQETEYLGCEQAAHPSINTTFTAFRLTQPDHPISLTDYFPEPDLLSALLADPVIQTALAKTELPTPPGSLAELAQTLNTVYLETVPSESDNQDTCFYQLTENFLTQFAFHRLHKDQVAVRVALPPAVGACRATYAQLELLLPLPASLKTALIQADTGKTGFLMQKVPVKFPIKIQFSTSNYKLQEATGLRVTTVAKARLRTAPHLEATTLERLAMGTLLKTLARTRQPTKIAETNDYWFLVEIQPNQKGWVFGGLTQLVGQNLHNLDAAPTHTILKDNVHLRSAPHLQSEILDKLRKNTQVKELTHSEQILGEYDWYLVRLETGKVGWVYGKFIQSQQDPVTKNRYQTQNVTLEWQDNDLVAFDLQQQPLFSAQTWARQLFEEKVALRQTACEHTHLLTPLSFVGTLLSLKSQIHQHCQDQTAPVLTHQWITLDLTKPQQPQQLTELFAEKDLLQGLLADPILVRALNTFAQKNAVTLPKFNNLDSLHQFLLHNDIKVIIGECAYALSLDPKDPQSLLTQFAFHHLKNQQVAVRMNLIPAHWCQQSQAQLGIYLNYPASLNTSFQQAANGAAGFLMNSLNKSQGQKSTLRFHLTAQSDDSDEGISTALPISPKPIDITKKLRIVTASQVNVRTGTNLQATVIAKLALGSLLEEVSLQEGWCQVALEDGQLGWLISGLTLPFENDKKADIYLKLTRQQLDKNLTFSQLTDVGEFLARIRPQILADDPNIAAELAFAYLKILQRGAAMIEQLPQEKRLTAPYLSWLDQQKDNLYFDETVGRLLVRYQLIWELHDQYYPIPITDQIAWLSTETLNWACQSHIPCYLAELEATLGKYLKFHPKGAYADQALAQLGQYISGLMQVKTEVSAMLTSEEKQEIARLVGVLKATLEKVGVPEAKLVFDQLDSLSNLLN